eukprot:TRINITY_DN8190_c0_g3_i1.p1 TRINITY_DN8190_c0_g3~~TRINITY_DN8190_c0_g3_i1.p1  ORF type:complete len:516 (-),score=109.31 TRINITY_DN8190_c0_g3_i1:8-1555(-)
MDKKWNKNGDEHESSFMSNDDIKSDQDLYSYCDEGIGKRKMEEGEDGREKKRKKKGEGNDNNSNNNNNNNDRSKNYKNGMHNRNALLQNEPNFEELAQLYPSFASYLTEKVDSKGRKRMIMNWKSGEATREYNRTLLYHYYGISIFLPQDQLCPNVGNRVNYIHFIQDLLTKNPISSSNDRFPSVKAIDIGTGASCIYPLLGAKINWPNWQFIGTDIDPVSLEIAEYNIQLNFPWSFIKKSPSEDEEAIDKKETNEVIWREEDYFRLIQLRKATEGKILMGVIKDEEEFDFCMCNPPFFSDLEETGLNGKVDCTAKVNELVTKGGETSFVSLLIEESLIFRERITWYSCMIGKKSDLKPLIIKLKQNGIFNFRTSELLQGRTTRWVIAWSFTKIGFASLIQEKLRNVNNVQNRSSFHLSMNGTNAFQRVKDCLSEVGFPFTPKKEELRISGTAFSNRGSSIEDNIDLKGIVEFGISILQTKEGFSFISFTFSKGTLPEDITHLIAFIEKKVKGTT